MLVLALVVALPPVIWVALYALGLAPGPGEKLRPPFNLSDRLASLEVVEKDGAPVVVFAPTGEGEQRLEMGGDAFLRELLTRKSGVPTLFKWLDITAWTGLFWVGIGFLGQGLFMGRMLVQWWASEKAKSAVVPPSFWWLSLVGSSMLMTYFVWRVEIVGFIGQSTGWLIYIRNLWFIHGGGGK
jgi:lipid-A-disaccharide synthase-like uncharacterized protein